MNLAGLHIMIAGLGSSGLAAARYVAAHGAQVSVADTQPDPKRVIQLQAAVPHVNIYSGALAEAPLTSVDWLVVSPGVPLSQPAIVAFRQAGKPIIGDIELLARALATRPDKMVAITGSNGKSTVTSLVGHICQTANKRTVVAGNIGLPVLEALLDCEQTGEWPEVWVLELSSFQLDSTFSLQAEAATVLNISADHLNRYHDLLDYAHAKTAIFSGNGVQVLNRDDPLVRAMVRGDRPVKWFSLHDADADYTLREEKGEHWLSIYGKCHVNTNVIPLQGLHNAANVLAAWALCDSIGIPTAAIIQGIQTFKGLAHRVEWVAEIQGVTFIDDSKATNVGAAEAALNGMLKPVVLIAGGDGKDQDFSPLRAACADKVRAVVLLGKDADKIEQAIAGSGYPLYRCTSLEEATETAYNLAQEGEIVLLSPACASLDMFRDYSHRSEVFVQTVRALAHKLEAS